MCLRAQLAVESSLEECRECLLVRRSRATRKVWNTLSDQSTFLQELLQRQLLGLVDVPQQFRGHQKSVGGTLFEGGRTDEDRAGEVGQKGDELTRVQDLVIQLTS